MLKKVVDNINLGLRLPERHGWVGGRTMLNRFFRRNSRPEFKFPTKELQDIHLRAFGGLGMEQKHALSLNHIIN
jgi:hypothetical protein